MSFRPRIESAHNSSARMDALCEFIDYWIGPRQQDYGELPSSLMHHSLPGALRTLYEFAGRWPGFHRKYDSPFRIGAFSTQDGLISLSHLRTSDTEKVEFLIENQGCWVCRTSKEGDDPPVWCEGDLFDEEGDVREGEIQVCDSLSRFLATSILQEMMFGSRFFLFDTGLEELFQRTRNEATTVWSNGPYVYGTDYDFYLWNGVLVGCLSGMHGFGANHPAGIEFLKIHQGNVIEIQLMVGLSWSLDIQQDGAATVEYRQWSINEKGNVPEGTFHFLDLKQELEHRVAESGGVEIHPILLLRRQGQTSTTGRPLQDSNLVNQLFHTAIERAAPSNPKLAKLMQTEWPFSPWTPGKRS